MANQLASSLSPYLLQHKENPVNWYPWSDEAIDLSKTLDRPIFLSVGYSACHWCHVMAHESFESNLIAKLLNEHFVNIKVDREERPDIDSVYMLAVQMMSGSGGWPMSVFLTPELQPFYAGTYFPPHRRGTSPGFDEIIIAVADAWQHRRGDAIRYAREITLSIQKSNTDTNVSSHSSSSAAALVSLDPPHSIDSPVADPKDPGVPDPGAHLIEEAVQRLHQDIDVTWGGFGSAPKFPETSSLELLLRYGHRTGESEHWEAVRLSLLSMCRGGVYDVLEGGFARYSTDSQWRIPHFEKMLYDNSLLANLYIDAYRISHEPIFRQVARKTLTYILDVLKNQSGGLSSSEDADSLDANGTVEEGAYYTWSVDEIREALGRENAEPFIAFYGATEGGNFDGSNVLFNAMGLDTVAKQFNLPHDELTTQLQQNREKLLHRRRQRARPRRDDKILTSWNALAIKALALGGCVFDEPRYAETATEIADYLWTKMRRREFGLMHASYQGTSRVQAYLDDYACLIDASVTLYETTGRARWIGRASRLADEMLAKFQDTKDGGFFYTSSDSETLIARPKEWYDASTPASNAVAAFGLIRLGRVALRDDYLQAARRTLIAGSSLMSTQSRACSKLLAALDLWHFGGKQWVFAARDSATLHPWNRQYFHRYRPHTGVAWVAGKSPEKGPLVDLLRSKHPAESGVAFYECEGQTCKNPIFDEASLTAILQQGSAN